MMAANVKYFISVNEIRTATNQQLRVASLINNLNEQAAERTIVSVLILSLGSATKPYGQIPRDESSINFSTRYEKQL